MYKWLLGAAALMAVALPARADFVVTITANGQSETYTQTGSGSGAVVEAGTANVPGLAVATGSGFDILAANVGGFTITSTAVDNNSPGDATDAHIGLTNNQIRNATGAGSITITEATSGAGTYASFTAPTGTENFTAQLAATSGVGSTYTMTQTAFLNGGLETTQSVNQADSGLKSKSVVVTTANPFNLSQTLVVAGLTTGHAISTNEANVDVTPTPAPAAALLALVGAPIIGFVGWRKRRAMATA